MSDFTDSTSDYLDLAGQGVDIFNRISGSKSRSEQDSTPAPSTKVSGPVSGQIGSAFAQYLPWVLIGGGVLILLGLFMSRRR